MVEDCFKVAIHKILDLARLGRNRDSECLAQRRQGRKGRKVTDNERIVVMARYFLAFIVSVTFVSQVSAAEKIRIGFPEFNSSTFTLPLAQIKGYFNEEGLQAELIRIRSAADLKARCGRC
jgi:hypothetical protein